MTLIPVLSKTDIEEVSEMAKEIWNEYFTPIIGSEQVKYMLTQFQSAKAINHQINDGFRYYFIHDSDNCGYTGINIEDNLLFISKLYIKSSHRGLGLGKKTLELLVSEASKNHCQDLYLTVNRYNLSTIAMYQKFGFEIEKPIIKDIGHGFIMDDYLMIFTIEN